ncbi:MAG: hypothetical protein QOJ86_1568 [Bradyrhizobium sp.]|jgi:hypothetical protein|nr:hypothetical protein [Bradyrhizobium sp.]
MSGFVERLIVTLIEVCFELFGYYTAKAMLPVISAGHIHVAPAHRTKPFATFGEPLFKRLPNGTIRVKHTIASLIGLLFWAAAIILFAAIHWFLN